jgi:hypothetical protein
LKFIRQTVKPTELLQMRPLQWMGHRQKHHQHSKALLHLQAAAASCPQLSRQQQLKLQQQKLQLPSQQQGQKQQ